MNTVAIKNNVQLRQHQAIHGHMKFIINAVGKLDLQTCLPHIADSKSLKNRIALYRWSLNDLKKAIQRDVELDKLVFPASSSLKVILEKNQEILKQIDNAVALSENAASSKIMREELNVILVKLSLAVNIICETIKLNLIKEEVLPKTLK